MAYQLNVKFQNLYQKIRDFLETQGITKYIVYKDYNGKFRLKTLTGHVDKFIRAKMPEYDYDGEVEIELQDNGDITILFLMWNENTTKVKKGDTELKGKDFRKLIVTLDDENKVTVDWEDVTADDLTPEQRRRLLRTLLLYAVADGLLFG